MSIAYCECVFVALGIQHALRMHHVTCHLWPTPLCSVSSTLSHKRHDFLKEKLLGIKCVFRVSVQILPETFLILRRTERDMIENLYRSECIYPIYNHNWRNISTIYIYNKTSIKRNIVTIKQNTSGSRLG
jgi:hypothetical protein